MTMKSSSESPYTRNGTVSPSRFPYYRFLPPLKSPPPLSAPPSKPPFREDYYGEHTYTAYDTHRFWVHGPHWPIYFLGELLPTPEHIFTVPKEPEPLWQYVPQDGRTIHTQKTKWYRPWEGTQNVFDSERTSKGTIPHTIPEGCCPSLVFESRFESGNLRQARRIGQFEYDLVLKTDLYTSRHTQWYYFRVQKMRPGVTYKFNIINLLKKDSLYNHGMRPLIYSEKEAEASGQGWVRAGHHISYSRSYGFNKNGLLHPEITYYVLEWQMEFKHEDDTCYLAHCYPFTFTDLCQHLDDLMAQPERRKTMRRDVLCESRAGNSCFLLTVSNFSEHRPKKGIVVTARVHPGETNASWMMRGLLDFITSSDPVAKELRKCYIFKIIPMLNPDGVIVGNYRCSLAGRDLNRNYRHPKKESFPTVWNTKQMLADFAEECEEILVYCDMHGHSRKHNVFIYGCDPDKQELDMAAFLCQRLFPWLLSQKAPDKFSFRGCKFRVKRCKEATGRVVMWRQMGISNSFTLEATFCGSKDITSHAPRHFNLQDFQDLGRHFCEALLVYHQAQENTSLHSELILELTKEITHHILLSRGLLPPNMPFPDLSSLKDVKQGQKSKKHGGSKADQDGSEWAGLDKRTKSKLAALKVIDTLSSETIQGCYDLLADLHINKEFAESDTSDSDSASESELPKGQNDDDDEDKVRKKKRKKKLKGRSKSEEGPAPDMNADEQSKKKRLVRRRMWNNPTFIQSWVSDAIEENAEKTNKLDSVTPSYRAMSRLQDAKKHLAITLKSEDESKSSHQPQDCNAFPIEARQYDLLPIHDTRVLASATNARLKGLYMDTRPFHGNYHGKNRSGFTGKKLPQLYGREGTSTLYRLIKPKTMEVPHRLGQERCVTELGEANQYVVYGPEESDENAVKKYPPFVNRYAKRSNHGIPMFSQERIQERAKLRMEATKCGDQDTGGGEENALDQVAHDTEYAKLIALSREMHRQSEEVRYKLINQPQEGALEKSLAGMTIRHSYTHGNSMVRGPPPFTLDFERLDSDEMGVLSTLPKTPPRKLDPVKGAAASRSNGGLSRAGALNGISGSDTANGYAITDGLLVGPGMRDGHGGAMKQSSGDASNHRTKGGGPHHPKRTSEEKATGGDNSKLIVFSGKDTKQTSNSFNSSSSASWATGNKGRTKDPSEPNYHSANAAHDKNRHLRKTLGRESTMDLIQRQYGRFLTGVNVNSQGAPSSSTSKYLDSIAKSVPSGNFPSSKEKGAGVTRSASFVNEKRIAPLTKMGDQAAILKLADVKKKSNSSS
nr:cytosolic carboxypeptidase 2-like isoform X1 [Lytechinus pictus]